MNFREKILNKKLKISILFIIAIWYIFMTNISLAVVSDETMAHPEKITEYIKKDGTRYNIASEEQKIITDTSLKSIEMLYGRYQFNYTGAGAVEHTIISGEASSDGKEAYPHKMNKQYYSKLSTLPGYEWLAKYENKDGYYDSKLIDKGTGLFTIKGNSTAGELAKKNEGDRIYKAYLVLSCGAKYDNTGKLRYLLQEYPITLIGPNTKYIKTKVETLFINKQDDPKRYVGYIDVTEFVKEQGYGWYYCCNVPYCLDSSISWDQYATWRLIVIEESEEIPLRVLNLSIGRELSSGSEQCSVEVNLTNVTTKSKGTVEGQMLYCLDGADMSANSSGAANKISLEVDGKRKDISYPDPQPPIYDENNYKKVYRTNYLKVINMMTRNNKPINNLIKFGKELEHKQFLGYSYTNKATGAKYVIGSPKMGGDTELIDFDEFNSKMIENNKKNVKFLFEAGDNLALSICAVGLAFDIEVPKYDAQINTNRTGQSGITINGHIERIVEDNTNIKGLHGTTTVIQIDPNIMTDSDKTKINLSYNDVTMEIPYESGTNISKENEKTGENINLRVNGNRLTIYWGKTVKDQNNISCNYTTISKDDKLKFEITGLKAKNIAKYEYINEVDISGQLYTSNLATSIMLNKIGWDISYLKIEDYIDLALKQFITSVERDGEILTVNREPKVEVFPIKNGGTTANYTHEKLQEWVKRNDIITYTVRIYNEGIFDVYADEINVYLPTGLEFIYSNTNREYGWSIQGTNQIYTNYLMNTKIQKFTYYDIYGNIQYKNELSYVDLKLECKVSEKVGPYTILTSLAEITKCHGVDDDGKKIIGVEEKDSNPDNLNVPNDTDKPNYGKNQEDDDDFEKVQLMYTDIQGNVWIDKSESNPKVQNMQVKLTDLIDGSTGVTRTFGEGYYEFKNIRVDHTYKIEFEYDGQTYTKSQQTASYASENEQARQELNDRFYEITKDGARNKYNSSSIVNFGYNLGSAMSQVIRTENPFNKGTEKDGKIVFKDMSSSQYDPTRMLSITEVLRGDTTLYYENIHFALQEREQLQLEVYSDLTDVITTIKGQSQTYSFGEGEEAYSQGLYPSDYAYKKELYQGNNFKNTDELEVYATYYIRIYNASNNQAQITELVNYYDVDFEQIQASAYSYRGKVEYITWSENSKYSNSGGYEGFKTAYTTSLEGVVVEPWTSLNIAVRYKVGKDENRNIILGDKKVATEIYSYASSNGLIDNVSKPDNLENMEKDSSLAPVLTLNKNDKSRVIKGFVWEDAVNTVLNGVHTGDGLFNAPESKIDNIEICLVERLVNQEGNVEEYILAEMNSGIENQIYVDNTGNIASKIMQVTTGSYEFNEIIPGNYVIRFTYGNNSVDFTYNGQDYKSTTANESDARDNKPRRKELLEIAQTMQNDVASILADPSINPDEYVKLASIFADTNNQHLTIEHENNTTSSIDLGLVRRPHTKLQITKEIQSIKLTNANIVLIDTANGVNTGVIQIKDMTHKELIKSFIVMMDDELLHGAELTVNYKIEVSNIGDKDNLANYFEYDPSYGTKEEQDKAFTTSASKVYDYTNSLVFQEEVNPDWKVETNYRILGANVQNGIRRGQYTVLSTDKLGAALKPGESTAVDITLTRIISASGNDDMQYLNEVEIVERQNEGSRRDEEAVPGNYVPGNENTKERDSWDTDVTVTNPTGTSRTYYWLIFVIAAVLGAGIVLIKKFVVDRR